MSELCVDASVAIKLMLGGEPYRAQAKALFADALLAGAELIAPPLFPYEIDGTITRRVADGRLSRSDAGRLLRRVDAIRVRIVQVETARQRAREIAMRFGQRLVYDSSYAALAEIRSCEFWTADRMFLDAVKMDLLFVKHIADYPMPDAAPRSQELPQ